MKKIKIFFKNSIRPIAYVLVGFLLGVAIYTAQAAWNTRVAPDDSLTAILWNDVVDKIESFDNLSCTTVNAVNPTPANRWVDVRVVCPVGYQRTGCSSNYNNYDGGSWGESVIPWGASGCQCQNGDYGDTTCYAYCCRLQ